MIPLSVGAHRVVKGVSVEHVCGEPELSVERDHELMLKITRTALTALKSHVDKETLFDPAEEVSHVA